MGVRGFERGGHGELAFTWKGIMDIWAYMSGNATVVKIQAYTGGFAMPVIPVIDLINLVNNAMGTSFTPSDIPTEERFAYPVVDAARRRQGDGRTMSSMYTMEFFAVRFAKKHNCKLPIRELFQYSRGEDKGQE
jgi:hypothetical protein